MCLVMRVSMMQQIILKRNHINRSNWQKRNSKNMKNNIKYGKKI